MTCEPASVGSGCSLACARCWAASGALLEAPACAQRCASGDQAYVLALILLAPCLGRLLVEGLVLPRVRSPGAKRKKKARRSGRKKSPRRQQYEDVDGGAAGVTFGQLLADGVSWADAAERRGSCALGEGAARLVFWHVLQPAALLVAFAASAPALSDAQWWIGASACAREALHLAALLLAVARRPAALLVDVGATLASEGGDDDHEHESGGLFLAMYALAPELFLTLASDLERGGNHAIALSFVLSLPASSALCFGLAHDPHALPPAALTAAYALASAGGLVTLKVASGLAKAPLLVYVGAALLLAAAGGGVAAGSGQLQLDGVLEAASQPVPPAELPLWQTVALAAALLAVLYVMRSGDGADSDDEDEESSSSEDEDEERGGRSPRGRKRSVSGSKKQGFQAGDKCEVFSVSKAEWFTADVIFVDELGRVQVEYHNGREKMQKLLLKDCEEIRAIGGNRARSSRRR